ncbi:MAG: RNA polymerase sigma factor [Gemmatimonadales bacterium]
MRIEPAGSPRPPDADFADVALAVQGDSVAFERLYRRHVARVQSLAQWLMGSTDTDEVVQEVFVRVWQKLATFGGQSAFGTWLHRVAVNLMLRRRQQRGRDQIRFVVADEVAVTVPARSETPELRLAIERAVSHLPAGAREVFVLHDMEGYKHDEIAEMLGVDPGTSRSQLHRARMMLRRVLTA